MTVGTLGQLLGGDCQHLHAPLSFHLPNGKRYNYNRHKFGCDKRCNSTALHPHDLVGSYCRCKRAGNHAVSLWQALQVVPNNPAWMVGSVWQLAQVLGVPANCWF